MSLSAFHYLFLQLSLSQSLSYFQPIFVSFVAISSVKCGCFKGISLVEFYSDRASLMYGLFAKKVAIAERWALVEV